MSGEAWEWVLSNVELNLEENLSERSLMSHDSPAFTQSTSSPWTRQRTSRWLRSPLWGWPVTLWPAQPPLENVNLTCALPFRSADQRLPVHFALLLLFSSSVVPDSVTPGLWPVVAQLCLTLQPLDCGPPGSSIRGILQARMLEWLAISFSRGSSQPRNWTQVFCIAGRFFTNWALREAPNQGWNLDLSDSSLCSFLHFCASQ